MRLSSLARCRPHVPPRAASVANLAFRYGGTIRTARSARQRSNHHGCRTVTRRGVEAEAMAAAFLERKGLRVLECNYRCRLGEIDLVARDGATTVFVEVRRRASSAFGGAAASITRTKRLRLVKAARHYLSRLG